MAYATQVTISTGNKVSLNYQSQEVSVTLTYQLEREDADVVTIVKEKTIELAQAHRVAWQTLRDAKVSAVTVESTPQDTPETSPKKDEETVSPTETPNLAIEPTHLATGETANLAQRITPGQLAALLLLLTEARWSEERRRDYLRERFFCDSVDDLSAEQAKEWLLELQRAEREAAQQYRLETAYTNGRPK